MDLEKVKLKFVSKLIGTHVKENPKTGDNIVETIFESECTQGDFAQYNKSLEHVVFATDCWEAVKCGKQSSDWEMEMFDPNQGIIISTIKPCVIKNIAIKVGKEGVKIVRITVVHNYGKEQLAIESAVSTVVGIRFAQYTEVFPGMETSPEFDAYAKENPSVLVKKEDDSDEVVDYGTE